MKTRADEYVITRKEDTATETRDEMDISQPGENREMGKQEPRGSKDATTLSSLIVHLFLLFFVFDGRTNRRTDILMSFLDCP